MKKIFVLLTFLMFIFLTGCGSKVVSIEADDIVACIENFNITDYTFKVVYKDSEETKQMTMNLFSQEDQVKFYELGEHQVTLSYEGVKKVINVTLEERKVIELKANPGTVSSYLKEFRYELVELELKYNDGTVETEKLSKSYLSNEDIISLGKPGTYDIEISIEGVSTTIHFELLPNETKIEDLTQDVIVYCITKKEGDVYASTFYVAANKDFSGLQFKLTYSAGVKVNSVVNDAENLVTQKTDEYMSVLYASSKNIKGSFKLFTIYFTANNQYRNFNLDYDFNSQIVYINSSNEVVEISNYLFTFTR